MIQELDSHLAGLQVIDQSPDVQARLGALRADFEAARGQHLAAEEAVRVAEKGLEHARDQERDLHSRTAQLAGELRAAHQSVVDKLLAGEDISEAIDAWQRLKHTYEFTAASHDRSVRWICRAAQRSVLEALLDCTIAEAEALRTFADLRTALKGALLAPLVAQEGSLEISGGATQALYEEVRRRLLSPV